VRNVTADQTARCSFRARKGSEVASASHVVCHSIGGMQYSRDESQIASQVTI